MERKRTRREEEKGTLNKFSPLFLPFSSFLPLLENEEGEGIEREGKRENNGNEKDNTIRREGNTIK